MCNFGFEIGWHNLPCWIDLRHVGLVHIRISHDFIQNCMHQEELIRGNIMAKFISVKK